MLDKADADGSAEIDKAALAGTDAEIKKIDAEEGSFAVGQNLFSTWTDFEFKRLLGYRPLTANQQAKEPVVLDDLNLTASVDWRDMNAVNAVKDQGQCGSCWAFSTIASIEGSYAILSSELELYSLAEQQLLDCDNEDNGCNGGNPVLAYAYFEAHTTMQEMDYPYLATDGHLCSYKKEKGVVQVSDFTRVTAGSDLSAN